MADAEAPIVNHYDLWVKISNEVDDLPDAPREEVPERVAEIVKMLTLYAEAR